MNEEMELLTNRIKEIYLTKNIFEMKEQMEEVDRVNKLLINYIECELQLQSCFGINNIDELLFFYKSIDTNSQMIIMLNVNDFYFKYVDEFNLYGKQILESVIEDIEDMDEDYVLDDVELVNTIHEDIILDREWQEYLDNQMDIDD